MDGENILQMSQALIEEEGTAADGPLTSRVKSRLPKTATPTEFVADIIRMEDSSSRHFSSSMEISPGSATSRSRLSRRQSSSMNGTNGVSPGDCATIFIIFLKFYTLETLSLSVYNLRFEIFYPF